MYILRSKSKMKDDLILRLNSNKHRLEQEVVGLKERLSKKADKQVKSGKQSAEHKENKLTAESSSKITKNLQQLPLHSILYVPLQDL